MLNVFYSLAVVSVIYIVYDIQRHQKRMEKNRHYEEKDSEVIAGMVAFCYILIFIVVMGIRLIF